MKTNTASHRAPLRLPDTASLDNSNHDNLRSPPKPLRRIITGLAAALTLGLFAIPGVSRADVYIDGTRNWDGITSPYTTNGGGSGDLGPNPAVGGKLGIGTGSAEWGVPEWLGQGILNQTAGTVTTGSGMWIGFNWAATGSSAYHMSGTAVFSDAANPSEVGRNLNGPYSGQTYTWSLADSASATVGSLALGLPDSYLLLSGAATFTAASLSFYDSTDYISFATGSTATLTVARENLASFTALVTAGNIRVDGVVQTDFSKFQVSGHTLSLSTGAPTPPQLVITSVSPASPTVGIGFDVTVETQDASNVPQNVTADTEVTLTLKIGTGTGTVGGTTTGTILNGTSSVTISGVTYTKPESGVVLEASASGLPTGESAPFSVLVGAPAKLAFGSQPNSTGVGDPIPPYPLNGARAYPAVTVLVQDAAGNLVTSDTSSVTIGGTTFTGDSTLTVSAVGGVATFSNLKPTTAGSAITLTASDGSLTEATSDPFTVGADVVTGVWYLQGPLYRSSDRQVNGDFLLGVGLDGWYPGWIGSGTLNQTGGTITALKGVNIGFNFGAPHGSSAYHMSGNAVFINSGAFASCIGSWRSTPGTTYTWSLTDTASATVGSLTIGEPTRSVTDSYLLLSGAATFTATSLTFYNSSDYVSFATGSTATLTVSGLLQADYEALVTAGNIRVDGVVQTDFSKFHVTGNTLSLGSGGGSYATWATTNGVSNNPNEDTNKDGVQNGIAYFMDDTGLIANPGIMGNTVTWTNGGNIASSEYGADKQFVVQTSTDLVNWTPVDIGDPKLANTASSVSYTLLPPEPGEDKLFVRFVVMPD